MTIAIEKSHSRKEGSDLRNENPGLGLYLCISKGRKMGGFFNLRIVSPIKLPNCRFSMICSQLFLVLMVLGAC